MLYNFVVELTQVKTFNTWCVKKKKSTKLKDVSQIIILRITCSKPWLDNECTACFFYQVNWWDSILPRIVFMTASHLLFFIFCFETRDKILSFWCTEKKERRNHRDLERKLFCIWPSASLDFVSSLTTKFFALPYSFLIQPLVKFLFLIWILIYIYYTQFICCFR